MTPWEALFAPFTNSGLLLEILFAFAVYLILATSLDLAVGYAGLFQLGHVGFFALGALGTTYATHTDYFGGDMFLGVLLGMLMTSLAVLLVGIPTLRLTGDYFAIATMGLGVMVQFVLTGIYANGIFGIPSMNPFGCDLGCMIEGPLGAVFGQGPRSPRVLELVLAWLLAFGVHGLVVRIKRSPFGRVLRSIKEDRLAAASLGKDVAFLRFQALWISALMASLAGSLTVHHFQILSPLGYGFPFMVLMLVMVILGGLGTFHGALIGALLVNFINQLAVGITEALRAADIGSGFDLSALRIIIFALVLIVLMLVRPSGILGGRDIQFRKLWRRLMRRAD